MGEVKGPTSVVSEDRAGTSAVFGNSQDRGQDSSEFSGSNAHSTPRYLPPEIKLWQQEFFAACEAFSWVHTANFIKAHWLDHRELLHSCSQFFQILPLYVTKRGFEFAFDGGGEFWVVMEVTEVHLMPPNDQPEIVVVDLLAFDPNCPSRWVTAMGKARGLGVSNAANPACWSKGPMRVWKTPLRWLQEGCSGVVILDSRSVSSWLGNCPGCIAGENKRHSSELTQLLGFWFDRRRIHAPLETVSGG